MIVRSGISRAASVGITGVVHRTTTGSPSASASTSPSVSPSGSTSPSSSVSPSTAGPLSGTFSHGNSVTFTGSGFGTKSTAAPLKYDDFGSVTVGAGITTSAASGPAWSTSGFTNSHNPVAATDHLRSGTPYTRNMKCQWTQPGTEASSAVAIFGQTLSKFMLDAWIYNDYTTGVSAGSPANVKHIRLHQASIGSPNLGFTDTGPNGSAFFEIAGDGKFNDYTLSDYTTAGEMYGAWIHVQWLIDPAAGGQATNGKVRVYVNGALRRTADNASLLNTGFTGWPELYVGNYVRTEDYTGNVSTWWESIYLDTAWARIEIGDNATYGSCTHREIQVPSAWSGSSVTFTVNRGSFASNAAVTLFVVDNSNAVVATQAVTLGTTY